MTTDSDALGATASEPPPAAVPAVTAPRFVVWVEDFWGGPPIEMSISDYIPPRLRTFVEQGIEYVHVADRPNGAWIYRAVRW